MNTGSFLQGRLRIASSTDRKKLQLRAMDLVLFGPPTREDYPLAALVKLAVCTLCCVPHDVLHVLRSQG